MTTQGLTDSPTPSSAPDPTPPGESALGQFVLMIRNRILEGLLVILPLIVTLWVIWWLYSTLEKYVIDPIAVLVLWKVRQVQQAPELPYWFETYAAPVIALVIALVVLFCCGVLAHSQLRRSFDKVVLRVPVVSHIYDAVRNVLQCFDRPNDQPAAQRVVLVSFPHPGMRLPAIVTSTCRDIATERPVLCVYVPTTPIPTSGFFLMVPEDEVTELNWDVQQTLQAIISGGLTAPRDVTYFKQLASLGAGTAVPGVNPNAIPGSDGNR